MQKFFYLVLAVLLVLTLCGCAKEPTIVGTWEEEITITVLGKTEQEGNHPALLRYTFAEDGTGTREVIPDTIPEHTQTDEFIFAVEGDVLTITITSATQSDVPDVPFEYTIKSMTYDSLEIYFYGVTNHLKRVE